MDIAIRFGITILIIFAGVGLYLAVTKLRLASLRHVQRDQANLGLDDFRVGAPTILYFTTPDCAPCQTLQSPAIEELRAQFGDALQIIKVDASERIDLANQWGVLSVPTTFIIDAQGQPRHVNNGVASAAKLVQQLHAFAGLSQPSGAARQVAANKLATHA
ncbi:MAG: thioredoxin family protein [Chloroflexi bacterium]|nr:thioredoxin family protein [Chloroflexota bacterium]